MQKAKCAFKGCGMPSRKKGLCPGHWAQQHRGKKLTPILRTIEERFWAKANKGRPDECWPWAGACDRYGLLKWIKYKETKAHRVSWIIHHGPIHKGRHVLHTCDNPPCVNPAHLFLGDPKANAVDRNRKGRAAPTDGENNGRSLLTWADVREIREGYEKGRTQASLGAEYGVWPTTIGLIVRRETWRECLQW